MGTEGPWFERPMSWPVLSRSAGFSALPKAGIIAALPRVKNLSPHPPRMWEHGPQDGGGTRQIPRPCLRHRRHAPGRCRSAAIEKPDFSLSIPLYVASRPRVPRQRGREPESLAEAWAKWKADGKTFWWPMDEVTAMLDGLSKE